MVWPHLYLILSTEKEAAPNICLTRQGVVIWGHGPHAHLMVLRLRAYSWFCVRDHSWWGSGAIWNIRDWTHANLYKASDLFCPNSVVTTSLDSKYRLHTTSSDYIFPLDLTAVQRSVYSWSHEEVKGSKSIFWPPGILLFNTFQVRPNAQNSRDSRTILLQWESYYYNHDYSNLFIYSTLLSHSRYFIVQFS